METFIELSKILKKKNEKLRCTKEEAVSQLRWLPSLILIINCLQKNFVLYRHLLLSIIYLYNDNKIPSVLIKHYEFLSSHGFWKDQ